MRRCCANSRRPSKSVPAVGFEAREGGAHSPCTWYMKTEQADKRLGELFLNCKDVFQLTAERFRREVMAGFSLNCLRSDSQLVARLPDASLNHEIRMETPATSRIS